MKCEEFRTQMSAGNGNEKELETHLSDCPECAAWLEREIAEPPQGLTPAQWQAATARCFPANLPTKNAPEPEKATSFIGSFYHGMTYGLVFGLSIVFGFAILTLLQERQSPPAAPSLSQVSFIESSERDMPVFFEKGKNNVTFYEIHDSEMVSFVEFDKTINFLDQEEEEQL